MPKGEALPFLLGVVTLVPSITLGLKAIPISRRPQRHLDSLDIVLDGEIDVVIGGHGFVATPGWIVAQRRYLGDLWLAVNEAISAGVSLAELKENIPFDERFAYVADLLDAPAEDLEARHSEILREFWEVDQ